MPKENLLIHLIKYVLPKELINYFELVSLQEEGETLHLYLQEHQEPRLTSKTLCLGVNISKSE